MYVADTSVLYRPWQWHRRRPWRRGDPAHVTWGLMLNRAQQHLSSWWLAVPPGLCILLVVLAINFIGDGMNASSRSTLVENI
jgi:hypothetical protein